MDQLEPSAIQQFGRYLQEQERSTATISKYLRTLDRFYCWLPPDKGVDKTTVMAYKEFLLKRHVPRGVNTILAALNGFFRFMGWDSYCVKALRLQRRFFSNPNSELSREEYQRLLTAAHQKGDTRLELLLQLMASTGIRVSEIRYVTADTLKTGRVQIRLKGKIRTILLSEKLRRKLRDYQSRQKITSGPLFLTRNRKAMDRRDIWLQMKRLCALADVPREKVFPHNLRHLFARTFYNAQKDIVKLADVLGHSSVETTRIYLLSSGQEHQRILDSLHLIC